MDPTDESLASLEKIREILVGSRLRGADERLGRIEARVTDELERLRGDVDARLRLMEQHFAERVEELARRFAQQDRAKLDRKQLAGLLTELAAQIDGRIEPR